MNHTRPRPLTPFGTFFGATPVLPSLYWDVYSAEQRWKAISEHLKKLCDYLQYLSGEVDVDRDTINQLLEDFQQSVFLHLFLKCLNILVLQLYSRFSWLFLQQQHRKHYIELD